MLLENALEICRNVRVHSLTAWGLVKYHNDGMELVCVFTNFETAEKAREAHTLSSEEFETSETFFVDELDFYPGTL